jgi:hypothetical protein
VETAATIIKVDGQQLAATYPGGGVMTATASNVSDGIHNAEVTIFDFAGNSTKRMFSFTVDTAPPTFVDATPTGTIGTRNPLLRVVASDGSGIDPGRITMIVNRPGVSTAVTPEYDAATGAISFQARTKPTTGGAGASALPDGEYSVSVTTVDRAGNAGRVDWSFTVKSL